MATIETISVTEPFLDVACALGEGPFVEEEQGTLRFVDIVRKELHTVALSGDSSTHRIVGLDDSVGVTADIEGRNNNNEFLVAAKRGFALLDRNTGKLSYIKKVYEDDAEMAERMRFNDGAVDSRGRFWAGTMNDFHVEELKAEGTVFRLDPDLSLHRMIENVSIPNGIGWSPDDKTMYFTDSPSRGIYAYDYAADAGTISNRRVFFQLGEDDGSGATAAAVLDGCAVDADGNVWAAVHEGSSVLKISPQGEVLAKVQLPAWKITCPVFAQGGVMFVTTAGAAKEDGPPEGSKAHGAVFKVHTGTRGMPVNKFGPF
ncbi:regucalcin like protein [Sphaerosporella brunnea]|uniref:Regucalcin like protein n=1 Tax=Sphaerosporella brunnea TaxID=1250544 RepID=A0A5J5EJK0_9PEZI|nr:regucalcin like protein [Sphaerosporella brunnea]